METRPICFCDFKTLFAAGTKNNCIRASIQSPILHQLLKLPTKCSVVDSDASQLRLRSCELNFLILEYCGAAGGVFRLSHCMYITTLLLLRVLWLKKTSVPKLVRCWLLHLSNIFDILFFAGLISLQKSGIILPFGTAGLLHQLEWAASRTALILLSIRPSIFQYFQSLLSVTCTTLHLGCQISFGRNLSFLHCSCVLKISFESEVCFGCWNTLANWTTVT